MAELGDARDLAAGALEDQLGGGGGSAGSGLVGAGVPEIAGSSNVGDTRGVKRARASAAAAAEDDDDDDDKPGRERRKIDIKFIQDKSRRHITFSKRKAGIMKKAYELSVLTGTQVLLLVVSETGLVYTFTTPKLQPLVTKPEGKNLIQACLNAPEPGAAEDNGVEGDADEDHQEDVASAAAQLTAPQASMPRGGPAASNGAASAAAAAGGVPQYMSQEQQQQLAYHQYMQQQQQQSGMGGSYPMPPQ